ncbi:MAG TPA: SDR family oxidoreductase [Ignavibacteriaceae bacterium]|nr:SDR family oxidoreductase [Ignavibacteriaceae bacterium]
MKNILITGVSKGLGIEITKNLILNGYCVYGVSRTVSDELLKLQNSNPEQIKTLKYDLSDVNNIKSEIFNKYVSLRIKIHGFVNNAAFAYDDIITNANYDKLKSSFDVNFFSPVIMTKHVIRNMIFHNISGSIVHISSISVHTGYKGLSMYAASKGAIEAFSKNTAREWGVKKIRSNCIVPGFMETEMSSSLSKEQKDKIYNRTSLKEPTDINSVANSVLFLLSDSSKSITGQNIHIDSGAL